MAVEWIGLPQGVGLVVSELGGALSEVELIAPGALLLEVNGHSVEKIRTNAIKKMLSAPKIRRLRFFSPAKVGSS